MKRNLTAAAVLALATPILCAHADPIVMTGAPPAAAPDPMTKFAMVGVAPGMTVDEALPKLKETYGKDATSDKSALVYNYRSVSVQTPLFTNEVGDGDGSNFVHVNFGPPNGGNKLFSVERVIEYNDAVNAPEYATLLSGLIAKYGKPTCRVNGGFFERLVWLVGPTGVLETPPSTLDGCRGEGAASTSSDIGSYEQMLSQGIVGTIDATIATSFVDPKRARYLHAYMTDVGEFVRVIQDAHRQLQAAGKAAYEKLAVPSAPQL